jgi:hypothetical protein
MELMVSKAEIDRIRTALWMDEIRRITRLQTVRAIAGRLDPESNWVDPYDVIHQSKWYQFHHGKAVPSAALVLNVKAQLPAMMSNVHHPVWSLLRNPDLTERSIQRLVSKMPKEWQRVFKELRCAKLTERHLSLELVMRYKLDQFDYLSALFLLALSCRWVVVRSGSMAAAAYRHMLLTLPLIFVHDPIWFRVAAPIKISMLDAFSKLVNTKHEISDIKFPVRELMIGMHLQEQALRAAIRAKKCSGELAKEKILFLARLLNYPSPYSPYARALAAFFTTGRYSGFLDFLVGRDVIYKYQAWCEAWEKLLASSKRARAAKAKIYAQYPLPISR